MMRVAALTLLAAAAPARATTPGQLFAKPNAGQRSFEPRLFGPVAPLSPTPDEQEAIDFAWLSGPGTLHRLEVTTETTFGTRGAGTERIEVAFAEPLGNTHLAVIARTGLGVALANERWLSAQGFFVSFGARMTSSVSYTHLAPPARGRTHATSFISR